MKRARSAWQAARGARLRRAYSIASSANAQCWVRLRPWLHRAFVTRTSSRRQHRCRSLHPLPRRCSGGFAAPAGGTVPFSRPSGCRMRPPRLVRVPIRHSWLRPDRWPAKRRKMQTRLLLPHGKTSSSLKLLCIETLPSTLEYRARGVLAKARPMPRCAVSIRTLSATLIFRSNETKAEPKSVVAL